MIANDFVSEISKLRPSATFLSLKGYRNDSGEVADYQIVFNISYHNALKNSIKILADMDLTSELDKQARFELLDSFAKSLGRMSSNNMEEIDQTYTRFYENGELIKGIKLHPATNTLHLYGLVMNKKVLIPGTYTKTNKKPLTIAKDRLRYQTPVGKFRQFKILPDQVDMILVENMSLIPTY